MDIQAYEFLRSGNVDAALNQLAQNYKAKKQCTLDGGDWTSAWLLTGIPDRLDRRRFAGSAQEMSTIAAYNKARTELLKNHRAETVPTHDEEEVVVDRPPKPVKPKAKAKAGDKVDP